MARLLLVLYLAIMLGPLALALALWAIRDGLRAISRAEGEAEAAGTEGSEEGLRNSVGGMRQAGVSR